METLTKADLAATKDDLTAALQKLKAHLTAWQIGLALALFSAMKFIH
jgi:hypothetical protein